MSKMEFLGALEAEKFNKQKWEQYCRTPCRYKGFYACAGRNGDSRRGFRVPKNAYLGQIKTFGQPLI